MMVWSTITRPCTIAHGGGLGWRESGMGGVLRGGVGGGARVA